MTSTHLNLIRDIVDYIETHLDQDVQVLELSKSVGLSPWHFQKLFKSLIGDSLGIYIRGRRLSRAAQVLIETEKGIIDIAFEAGFNSHEAFSRAFKSHFNLTPKDFRNEKPTVLLKNKPVLSEELLQFMSKRIDKEPSIHLNPAREIAGYTIEIPSPFFDPVHCSTIATPWMKLLEQVPKILESTPTHFYGVMLSDSGNFTEETLTYLAGIEFPPQVKIPIEMRKLNLPGQQYAIFDVTPNVADDNLKQKIDCIYGYWLPNSNYNRGQGTDFEMFESIGSIEDVIKGKFKASYLIPVDEKSANSTSSKIA